MTTSLQRAFAKAADLPADIQEQLAEQLMDDIQGELAWDATFAASQPALEKLAAKARLAKKEGKLHHKGFDEL